MSAVDAPAGDVAAQVEMLFREARARRRRRWLVGFVTVVLLGAATGGLVASQGGGPGRGGGHPTRSTNTPPREALPVTTQKPSGVALPSSALINDISVTPSGLFLTGNTVASAGKPQPTCAAATVNPKTLAIGSVFSGSCSDPTLQGRSSVVVNTYGPKSSNAANIAISVANRTTGHFTVGPVVMTYASYSDTRPVIVYGNQWIWIYGVATSNGPELLQISAASGDVVDTVRMPALYRPLMAEDAGGVWIGNSISGSPAPALFFVALGATTPTGVIAATNVPICWLVASGTSAWVGAGVKGACVDSTIERFADGRGAPTFAAGATFATTTTVVGDESDGFWTMVWSSSGPDNQNIIRIDPDSGSESAVTTVANVDEPKYIDNEGLIQGQGVFYDGALYLLEPPFREYGYLGYASLVRLVPHGPRHAVSTVNRRGAGGQIGSSPQP